MKLIPTRTIEDVRRANNLIHKRTYDREHPEMFVRRATIDFLSKKEELKDQIKGQSDWQDKLLDDLVIKIREILNPEGGEK